jgi:hypothetical protein
MVVMAALLLASCGGGSQGSTETSAYATRVCGAFRTWIQDIQQRNQTLTSSLGSNATPTEGKKQLEVFLDSVISDTDKLIQSVNSAGTPDVEGGQTFASRINGAATAAKSSFQTARQQVEQLPTDAAGFKTGAERIGSQIRTSLGSVSQVLGQGPESNEIKTAFQQSSACKTLAQTTGGASPGS